MLGRTAVGLVCILLLAGAAFGQTESRACATGTWLTTGQFGFDMYFGDSDGMELNFVPRLLYFLSPGVGLGGEMDVWYEKVGDYNNTDFAIGPRFAYYLRMPRRHYPAACCLTGLVGRDGWWLPFVGASVLYQTSKWGAVSTSGYLARAGIGVSPLIGSRGTLTAELGFQRSHLESSDQNSLYLEAGFGAFLFR